jgi:ribosomal protein L13E
MAKGPKAKLKKHLKIKKDIPSNDKNLGKGFSLKKK